MKPTRFAFAVAAALLAAGARAADPVEEPTALQPGVAVERTISSEQKHRYTVPVIAGDFVRIAAKETLIDVRITAGGVTVGTVTPSERGPEVLPVIAESTGLMAVEVWVPATMGGPRSGSYEVVVETHPPSDSEHIAVQAARELFAGQDSAHGRESDPVAHLEKAITLSESIGDKRTMAAALFALSYTLQLRRENAAALKRMEQLMTVARELGEPFVLAQAHLILARGLDAVGRYQKGLEHCETAIATAMTLPGEPPEAMSIRTGIIGCADSAASLGNPRKALDYYEQGLALAERLKNKFFEGSAIHGIGQMHAALGNYDLAVTYFERALANHRATNQPRREAWTLTDMASIRGRRGDTAGALAMLETALTLSREKRDRLREGAVLDEIGELQLRAGQYDLALAAYNEARSVQKGTGARRLEAASLFGVARAQRGLGALDEAKSAIEECVAIVETLRADVEPRDLRLSFGTVIAEYYETHVDILMALHERTPKAGWDARAFEASERARARVLLESLHDLRVAPGEVPPELLSREQDTRERLADKERSRTYLAVQNPTAPRLQQLDRDIRQLLGELHEIEAEIRRSNPRYAELLAPAPPRLANVQSEALDGRTALVEFALGRERSFVWLVTRDGIAATRVLPKRSALESEAVALHALLSKGDQRTTRHAVDRAAARVGEQLLGSITIPKSINRLVIVPDGSLHYVPFAALPYRNGRALVDDYELASAPSASTLVVLRQLARPPDYTRAIDVLADPVFSANDPRVSGKVLTASADRDLVRAVTQSGIAELQRLPSTRAEAQAIRELAPRVHAALDFDASRDLIVGGSRGAILHIATHALINAQEPELSGIILSMVDRKGQSVDGFVRAHDLYGLRLSSDLVVLSGCRTAIGKELRGEGMVGLTSGFMYAGAPRVVASYWDVKDRATAELMKHFYRAVLRDKLPPAAALHKAQLAVRADPRWSSPYYWAAFALHGEWR